jgi:hypothetical protein
MVSLLLEAGVDAVGHVLCGRRVLQLRPHLAAGNGCSHLINGHLDGRGAWRTTGRFLGGPRLWAHGEDGVLAGAAPYIAGRGRGEGKIML